MLSAGLENTREFLKLPSPAKKGVLLFFFYVQEVELHFKKAGTLNGKMLLLRIVKNVKIYALLRAGKLSKS